MNRRSALLLAALFAVLVPSAARAEKVYWSDTGAGRVSRAALDGAAVETLVDLPGSPRDLTVAGGKIYWVDDTLNAIRCAELDGSSVTDLVFPAGTPTSVAVDTVHARLYWTTEFPPRLERSLLDGSGVETLLDTAIALPRALALDVAGDRVYFANNGDSGTIVRTDLDGANPTVILSDGLAYFQDLAFHPGTGALYWVELLGGKLETADGDGAGRSTLLGGLNGPRGIALDPAEAKVYWTETGVPRLSRANLNGSVPETLVDAGLVTPWGVAIGPAVYVPNDAPALSPIADQVVSEGAVREVSVAATDPDGNASLTLSLSGAPAFVSLADLGGGAGTITIAPPGGAAGVYPDIIVTASDGAASDADTFTVTVVAPGQPPVLEPLDDVTMEEGDIVPVPVTANDPDGNAGITLSATGLPAFASFTDHGNGSGTLLLEPVDGDAGFWPGLVVTATDGVLSDAETLAVAVSPKGNAAPSLFPIGTLSLPQGTTRTWFLNASDPDLDALTFSAEGLPAFASFDDLGNGKAALTLTPPVGTQGTYTGSKVTVSDGYLTDFEVFAIVVGPTNRPPVLAAVGPQTVAEGAVKTVNLSATDPDAGQIPAFSLSGNPPFVSLNDNGDGTAVLRLEPGFAAAGTYPGVTVTATDGLLGDSETITVTVTNVNRPPRITPLADRTVAEGSATAIPVVATDPDGTAGLVLGADQLPSFVTFTPQAGGLGTLQVTPGFADAGVYPGLRVFVSDGSAADTTTFTLTVTNVNRAPVLASIADAIVKEGTVREIAVSAADPDGASGLTLAASGLPAWGSFEDLGGGNGRITLSPPLGSAGQHGPVTVTASDGALTDDDAFAITVLPENSPPAIEPIDDAAIAAGEELRIDVFASDPDDDPIVLAATDLPPFVGFEDKGDGTGFFTVAPEAADEGVWPGITVTASDGALTDTESFTVTVTVTTENRPPVLAWIGAQTVEAGTAREVAISAEDPDGNDGLVLAAANLPAYASFQDLGDGEGVLTLSPDAGDLGAHPGVTVTVSDGQLTDQETFAIAVVTENLPPVLGAVRDVLVLAGTVVEIPVAATDPNGPETLSLFASGLPSFVAFQDVGLGTGRFTISPPANAAGTFGPIRVVASDGASTDEATFHITVRATNRPPVLSALDDLVVDEGEETTIPLDAFDPDADPIALSGVALPGFVSVTDNGDGTGFLRVAPDYEDAGTYAGVGARATDGLAEDVETFTLTVRDVNRPPVLHLFDLAAMDEGEVREFSVTADDPDGNDGLALTTGALPAFLSFTDVGAGRGTFTAAPGYEDAGVYGVTVSVSDGALTDSGSFLLHVNDVDRPTVVGGPETLAVAEGDSLTAAWTAFDPDGGAVEILPVAASLPPFAEFRGGAPGDTARAEIVFRPGFADAGPWSFTLRIVSGSVETLLPVSLTVTNVNLPPVVDPLDDVSIDEGATGTVTVRAIDPDDEPSPLTLSASALPAFVSFTDLGNGDGELTLAPGFADAGAYPNVTVIASDGAASSSRSFTVTVRQVARPPVIDAAPSVALWEGEARTLAVSASTPDGPASEIVLGASGLPPFAAFTDQGDGTGLLTLAPGFDAAPYDAAIALTAEAFGATASASIRVRVADLSPDFAVATNPGVFQMFAPGMAPSAPGLAPFTTVLGASDPRVWRLGRFNPATGGYDEAPGGVSALGLGQGFWIVTREAATIPIAGTPWFGEEFASALSGGPGDAAAWNQMGSPAPYPFPVAAILVTDGAARMPLVNAAQTLAEPALWTWRDGGYVELGAGDVLQPGDAFWVRKLAAGAVSLVFPRQDPPETAAATRRFVAASVDESARVLGSLRIDAEQAGRHALSVELGAAEVPVAGWNALARALVPAAPGGGLRLAARHDDWDRMSGDYVRSYRAPEETLAWALDLRGAAQDAPVTLRVDREGAFAERRVYWAVGDAPLRELAAGEAIRFTPTAETTRLRVVVTASGEAPEPAPRPLLLTAAPNPFASGVEFRVHARTAGDVEVSIHDAAGRLVRRMRATADAPGELRLRWDGRAETGSEAPAGIYLVRARGAGEGAARIVRVR